MAPTYPDEVDVFTVPHSRMKQLVHKYLDMVSSTNFSDAGHMTSMLEKLCHTFHEFKTHEQIENRFIMRRLKEKLTALSITDTAVCNCHSDNRLTEMLSLVLEGYRWAQRSEHERVHYGTRLRQALEDFTQVFLPHMKEEEEVFQPMLIEYFTYEELKELKMKVIQKHLEKAEECEKTDQPVSKAANKAKESEEDSKTCSVPDEVMLNIFSYLSPRDLARCAQVSNGWNQLALDPSLWPGIYPVQWATGDWSFHPSLKDDDDEECGEEATCSFFALDDEDADVDESSDSEASDAEADASLQQALREVRIISGLVKHVLKRVGGGVRVCNLAHSRGISSSLVHKILKLCPNLHTLSLAHTRVTDAAFKEYGLKGQVGHLEHLDLTGCENVTDATLHSLTCYSAHCQDPLPASTSGITCPQDGSSTPPVSDHDSVISDRLPSSERLVPIVHPVISLSPPPVSENSGPSHSEFHLSFLESEALIEDPTFTDLSALELCDLDCLARNICNQRSEGENSTRGCCQTRDIFGSKEGKDRNSTGKTPKRLDSGEADVRNVPKTGCCSGGEGCEGADGDGERELSVMSSATLPHSLHGLRFLSLNGCFRVQDSGLRVLSERGGLPSLQHLDLSGCLNLTGAGVARLVEACPTLDHAHLFYCDNLFPDPFPTTASGCRNLQCTTRICCRSGD